MPVLPQVLLPKAEVPVPSVVVGAAAGVAPKLNDVDAAGAAAGAAAACSAALSSASVQVSESSA